VTRCVLLALALLGVAAGAVRAQETGPAATSCVVCHADAELFEGEALAAVGAFADDVHAEVGLSCHDCHGGDPDPRLADDMFAAMDDTLPVNPYLGVPGRTAIPGACGRCHSDPVFMRRYDPGARADQEEQYWTSQHGLALAGGDTAVATCVDCHGAHGIRRPEDPASPVHATRVADTCASCHADPEHMAGRTLPDGRPLPVDQYARWRQSVHADALLGRGDASAPTCNDCHGNHGAAPPGVGAVAFVCGQCHGREAELFRASPKSEGLLEHGELLAAAGVDGCAACHTDPEPQAALTDVRSLVECETCHGNHLVVRASVALLSPLPETPCAFCHQSVELAGVDQEPERRRRNYRETERALLARAAAEGLEGDDRFDWLIDQALALPFHTLEADAGADGTPALRPEFGTLFDKFRIGKTSYRFIDPATGAPAVARVRRCAECHAAEPLLGDQPTGLTTAHELSRRMRELTTLAAAAERVLLAARRGGVEVRDGMAEVEQAVTAQIGLEALVHTFSAADGGAFEQQHTIGLEHARAAFAAGREALDELAARRHGLAVALAIIVLCLLGLALKIRQLSTAGTGSPPPETRAGGR
jgi:hypothetical protein